MDAPSFRYFTKMAKGIRFGTAVIEAKRLFIGLELPEACRKTLADLDPELPGLRWLPSSQLHLTMSFLGQVNTAGESVLCGALSAVKVPPFLLPLCGLGVFNARGRPSVVWAGVGKGHPHLFALHHHIQDAVLHAGLEADLKPFHPHVTVARVRNLSSQALKPFLRRHAEAEFGLFQVTSFTLFSSDLLPEGAKHHAESSFPLAS